jgi:hypothetical protein
MIAQSEEGIWALAQGPTIHLVMDLWLPHSPHVLPRGCGSFLPVNAFEEHSIGGSSVQGQIDGGVPFGLPRQAFRGIAFFWEDVVLSVSSDLITPRWLLEDMSELGELFHCSPICGDLRLRVGGVVGGELFHCSSICIRFNYVLEPGFPM